MAHLRTLQVDEEIPDEPEDKADDDDISHDSLIKKPKAKSAASGKPAAGGKAKAKPKPKAKKA